MIYLKKKQLLAAFLFVAMATLTLSSCNISKEKIDLIVHNGTIYTVDNENSVFEAMAVHEGKILEVGAERQILNKYKSDQTIDLQLKTVFPGFIDAHCHFLNYGLGLNAVDLVNTHSYEEVIKRTQKHANKTKGWIIGRGWDQNDWISKDYPTKLELDVAFPNRPVLLSRIDGHAAIANSKALGLAGLHHKKSVAGGEIVRDQDGEPTGILIDNAVDLVRSVIPPPTKDQKIKAMLKAEQNCFAVGLTTLDDAGLDKDDILLIDSLQKAGVLKMKVYAMVSDSPENLEYFLANGPIKTPMLNVRSFKFYADGALGSRGACLLQPYSDVVHTKSSGFLLSDIEHFKTVAQDLELAGFQMNTHCIGDSANRALLEIYGEVLKGQNDKRWRIEHAQVVHKKDIDLFSKFSIIPSIQPTHATSDMYWAEQRLGRNRVRRAYAYQELKQETGLVCLGTDFPVEGISPFNTFYAAVVRKDHKNYPIDGFQKENALTREESIKGMTFWAALASFEEEQKGSLEVGKEADFVVLNYDLYKVPEDKILETKVLRTFSNGEEVYNHKSK